MITRSAGAGNNNVSQSLCLEFNIFLKFQSKVMKTTRFLKVIFGCKLLLLVFLGQVFQVFGSSCRSLEISTIIKEKVLTNHTIRTIRPIIDARTCRAQCFLEPLCFGMNFCVDEDRIGSCELIKSDHIRSERELEDKPGCTFYGSETGCSSNPCVSNATCQGDFVDTQSHRCICPAGYTGQMCEIDIDECTSGVNECSNYADCTNFPGGYNCTCKSGFYGDGKVCVDIDECALGNHGCHVNATCSNTMGSHQCACKDGHHGDGYECEEIQTQPQVLECEDDTLTMSCPSGQLLRIQWALYGRSSKQVCIHSKMTVPCGNETSSLIKVKNLCEGKQSCSFIANSGFFGGDPCQGFYKYTEVRYGC